VIKVKHKVEDKATGNELIKMKRDIVLGVLKEWQQKTLDEELSDHIIMISLGNEELVNEYAKQIVEILERK
jgi:hypothetical protein